jgi:hypothetical protein
MKKILGIFGILVMLMAIAMAGNVIAFPCGQDDCNADCETCTNDVCVPYRVGLPCGAPNQNCRVCGDFGSCTVSVNEGQECEYPTCSDADTILLHKCQSGVCSESYANCLLPVFECISATAYKQGGGCASGACVPIGIHNCAECAPSTPVIQCFNLPGPAAACQPTEEMCPPPAPEFGGSSTTIIVVIVAVAVALLLFRMKTKKH